MTRSMRQPTLETLGLDSVLDIFRRGRLPVDAAELVDRVFGEPGRRGCLVVTGANGGLGLETVDNLAALFACEFVRSLHAVVRACCRDVIAATLEQIHHVTGLLVAGGAVGAAGIAIAGLSGQVIAS